MRATGWRRTVAFLTPATVLTALLGLTAVRPVVTVPLPVARPDGACRHPPVFTVAYQREDQGLYPVGRGFRFQGVSLLSTRVCGAGTLVIEADGEAAAGRGPQLDVALDGELLGAPTFTGRRTVRIRVPRAGQLSLAYLNDLYRAEVRIVDLMQMELRSTEPAGCPRPGFTTPLPQGLGVSWAADRRSATLTWAGPLTLQPCAAGTLHLRVRGRAAQGQDPLLEFSQPRSPAIRLRATADVQSVIVPVSTDPLKVVLVNPLNRTVEDRNLNVRSVRFLAEGGAP